MRAARCAGPRAENVVKDVGLLEIVQLFFGTNKSSRGKRPIGKVIEENIVGYKLQDWNDAPTSELRQPPLNFSISGMPDWESSSFCIIAKNSSQARLCKTACDR